ncbi:MAG TPA: hypothetical protein VK087_01165 [Tissierellaceae bacterium]|nr:hypothetical protein [Tissierellaceae bacterium]
METRVDKYKRKRKEKRIRNLKYFVVFIIICGSFVGIKIVDETARELDCLVDTNILYYDLQDQRLEIFGNDYFLNLERIKNIFKRPG